MVDVVEKDGLIKAFLCWPPGQTFFHCVETGQTTELLLESILNPLTPGLKEM